MWSASVAAKISHRVYPADLELEVVILARLIYIYVVSDPSVK